MSEDMRSLGGPNAEVYIEHLQRTTSGRSKHISPSNVQIGFAGCLISSLTTFMFLTSWFFLLIDARSSLPYHIHLIPVDNSKIIIAFYIFERVLGSRATPQLPHSPNLSKFFWAHIQARFRQVYFRNKVSNRRVPERSASHLQEELR